MQVSGVIQADLESTCCQSLALTPDRAESKLQGMSVQVEDTEVEATTRALFLVGDDLTPAQAVHGVNGQSGSEMLRGQGQGRRDVHFGGQQCGLRAGTLYV